MSEKPPGKIIIDSDWKDQVAQEKEQLRKQASDLPTGAADASHPSDDSESYQGEIPDASFLILIVNMASQAMAALGQIPDPLDGTIHVDLEVARFHIDMLSILQEKTRGNLDSEEARYLESTLSQLRLAFVAVRQRNPSHG